MIEPRNERERDALVLREAAAILDRRYRTINKINRRTVLSAAASGILEKTAYLLETGRE